MNQNSHPKSSRSSGSSISKSYTPSYSVLQPFGADPTQKEKEKAEEKRYESKRQTVPVVQNAHTPMATTATVTQYPLALSTFTAEAGAPEVAEVVPLANVPLI